MVSNYSISKTEEVDFLDAYGIDLNDFLDTLADRLYENLRTAHDANVVSILKGSFSHTWAEHADIPVFAPALDEALLPATLVTANNHADTLQSGRGLKVKKTIRAEVVPSFFETVVAIFYEKVDEGVSNTVKINPQQHDSDQ
jgi:hypothetical protein